MFASAFRDRRAIVPMSVYYQRQTIGGSKHVFAIFLRDGEPMAVAGLWESFRLPDGTITRTYCIITTNANSLNRASTSAKVRDPLLDEIRAALVGKR